MKKQFAIFLMRWFVNSCALLIVVALFGDSLIRSSGGVGVFVFGGLLLALVNALIRPLVVALSLPLIVLSLGLFMLVINGLMVYWAVNWTPGLDITFVAAIVVSLVMAVVNYLFNIILEPRKSGLVG